jgi:hypothetical protein
MSQKRKQRIEALSERLKRLQVQQSRADSRQRTMEARKARKEDTRRKVLAGSLVLTCLEDGRLSKNEFYAWLDQALDRPDDRALFGLGIQREQSSDARVIVPETDPTPSTLNLKGRAQNSAE